MDAEEFKRRTKSLSLRFIRLVEALPNTRTADVIGSNYFVLERPLVQITGRHAEPSRPRDMLAKLKVVEEEADESIFWMELLTEADLMPLSRVQDLMNETEQILAMTVTSIKTLRNPRPKISR